MTEFSPDDLRDNPANIASHLAKAFKTDDLVCIFKALNEAMRAQNVSAVARTMGVRRERLYTTFGGEMILISVACSSYLKPWTSR